MLIPSMHPQDPSQVPTNQELWDKCLLRLEKEISERDLNTWLRPLRAVLSGEQLTLYAPNRLVIDRVKADFMPAIQRAVELSTEVGIAVQLAIGDGGGDRRQAQTSSSASDNESVSFLRGKLDPRYTLNSFVEGKSNSQARAACLHVASSPGALYNPLLIYGESGLGKTHLMHGIGNAIVARSPQARVVYVLAEQWYNQFVSAIRFGRMSEFKDFYRTVDALMIDDIHFFAAKQQTQEEFFHTFNALIDGRRQIILTCDRYPRELDAIDERLKSRFTWGLSVAVEPPEFETRVAILLNKADAIGLNLPPEVAALIAQRIRSNVRELEGALHRLNASARLTGTPITADFVRTCLRDMFAVYDRAVSLDSIKKTVAGYFNVRITDLSSERRSRTIARPRQIAMALAKQLTQHSYPEIGEAFSKDHTTVLHACRKVEELRGMDDRVREDYENLLRMLST
jgi:chromosomal replication initiator protein